MRIEAAARGAARALEVEGHAAGRGFGDALARTVGNLADLHHAAERAADAAAVGDLDKLHEAVIAVQKASLALELAVTVRNHVTEGVQELLRTQV